MAAKKPTSRSTSSRRSGTMPVSPRDHAMSVRHLKDAVKYNENHERDHAKAKAEDKKKLAKVLKSKAKGSSSGKSGRVSGS